MRTTNHRLQNSVQLLLALLAGLSASGVQASSPVVLNSTVGLTNVKIELIDLDPNDGITPALTFNGQGLLASHLINFDTGTYSGPSYTSGSFLPTQEIRYDDANATNVATPSSLSISSHITWDRLAANMGSTPSGEGSTSEVFAPNSADLMTFGKGGFNSEQPFTLTANTALVIRGTMTISSTLQGSTIAQALQDQGYTGAWQASRTGYLNATVGLRSWTDYIDGQGRTVGHTDSNNTANLNLSPALKVSNDQLLNTDGASSDFVVNFSNFSRDTKTGLITMGVQMADDLTLMTAQAIPEPSTYSLMGLGLVGIALTRRRITR